MDELKMDEASLAFLAALDKKASEAPWQKEGQLGESDPTIRIVNDSGSLDLYLDTRRIPQADDNAWLIIAVRNCLPHLLADRATLIAEVKRLEEDNRHLDFTRIAQQVALAKAEDARDAALARVAEMEGAWVPVGERLPDTTRAVLICHRGELCIGCHFKPHDGQHSYWFIDGMGPHESEGVTHWREVPTPP